MLNELSASNIHNIDTQARFVTSRRDTSKLHSDQQIYLNLRTGILPIRIKGEATLGRFENHCQSSSLIDLSTFGATEYGISREHAKLVQNESGQICIVDLDSTNGTYINEEQLNRFVPYPLDNGDVLRLGRCIAHVLFEENMFSFA